MHSKSHAPQSIYDSRFTLHVIGPYYMDLYHELKQFGRVKTNEFLSKHTTFKIGGPADFFIVVEETEKLVELLRYLDGEGEAYFILGGGSNVLASDDGFRGVVINILNSKFQILNSQLLADAGCATVALAQQSIKAGLTGFEWGVGVPGTIGGAVRGNAGAMGGEMKDVVKSVEVYRDGEIVSLSNHECHYKYRESVFKHNREVILRVTLQLCKLGESGILNLESKKNSEFGVRSLEDSETGDKKPKIFGLQAALDYLKYRNTTQPQGRASCGCIFKNVELLGEHGEPHRLRLMEHFDSGDEKVQRFLSVGKISAGWLVEQAGLKGRKIGQAEVSERHGNFIVNLGGAKALDTKALIDEIKEKVYSTFGIELEEEIEIL